jgi:proteic killer suppression protein
MFAPAPELGRPRHERVFRCERVARWAPALQRAALRKLVVLDAATSLEDLRRVPGNHLEKLVEDRRGQWSIRINDQCQVCFRWAAAGAHDVAITDHH